MDVVRQLVKRHPNSADEAVCERKGRVVSEAEHIKPCVQRGFDIGFIRADGVLAAGCVRVKIMLHIVPCKKMHRRMWTVHLLPDYIFCR